MLFRYDFGEKLDLTKFDVQAKHYVGQAREINYYLVLPNYKLTVNITTVDNTTQHLVSIRLFHLIRDENKEIKNETYLYPSRDIRFQDFKIIKEVWANEFDVFGGWTSSSVVFTVDRIIILLKIVSKINNLQVFL